MRPRKIPGAEHRHPPRLFDPGSPERWANRPVWITRSFLVMWGGRERVDTILGECFWEACQ